MKKLTGSLFLKNLISTLISVLTPLNLLKETCPLYFHNMCKQSGQNQANMRSSVLKLKHPLRIMFWSNKFVVSSINSLEQFADGPEVGKFT